MKILFVGAGAVGGYYGQKLTLAGEDVLLLARGLTFQTLRQNPLIIEDAHRKIQAQANVSVVDNLSGIDPPDLIIITVKSYDTDKVLRQLQSCIGRQTIFLSLQNGVENEAKLISAFGREKVLGGFCYLGAEVVHPGLIRQNSAKDAVHIGEMDGSMTPRLQAIADVFHRAGIETHVSQDIQKGLWTKLCWNAAFNQVCALVRASVGEVLDVPETYQLLQEIMGEVLSIAEKHRVFLPRKIIDDSLEYSKRELREVRPSMLQDILKGNQLEHEVFSGFVVREGRKFNISTPIHRTIYQLLCFLNPKRSDFISVESSGIFSHRS